ncbi:MAG TPA: molybdate ABC transporter substrate-binding protein [Polyangia bacterium]|jgi:molybdate transport system substrate-binding protein|nr:molybdate ABC transporter substrate-binding protein [Polyangia bacterium]
MKIILLTAAAALLEMPTTDARAATERTDLVVFAAASLRDVFDQLGKAFEGKHPATQARFNFAGSQELRLQIEQGAKADVFASADHKQMDRLVGQGAVTAPVVFARNDLMVVVPRSGTDSRSVATEKVTVRTFSELPRARRIVVAAAEVPLGAYTAEVLRRASANLGQSFGQTVESHVVSRELNARQVLAKVVLGEADAGVVYRTDALGARDKVEAVEIPPDFNVNTDYPVAAVKGSKQGELARAFVEYLLTPAAQKALAAAGFAPGIRVGAP